jgi:hypothetical protein
VQELVIIIASAGGGAMIKGIFDVLTTKRTERGAKSVAQIEADTSHEGRLWDRITLLEQRVDAAHAECMEQITREVAKESEACDQKINAKLRSQAAQLRAEFRRGLDERTGEGD